MYIIGLTPLAFIKYDKVQQQCEGTGPGVDVEDVKVPTDANPWGELGGQQDHGHISK
jgi:hypothetical protein